MTAASVIVPARDAVATLPATLDALAAQRGAPGHELLVVDDGSADGTAELAERHPAVTRVIRLGGGTGPGAARHAGARAARGAALAFIDADTVPEPGWLAAGLRALEHADLVQGRVLPQRGQDTPFDRTLAVTAAWGLFESANLFLRRDLYERTGGFEDWIDAPAETVRACGRSATVPAKHLGEDVWLGWRARRLGARTGFCRDALAHHAVFPRGAAEYVAERRRLRHFPRIARRVPELRGELFFARLFLSRTSAAFDAAVVGLAVAAVSRSPLPLAAALPYANGLRRRVRHWPRLPPAKLAAAFVAADAVGCAALVRGSVAARTPVL